MVAVTVDAGWRKDPGQAIQELESRETQGSAAGGIGFRQEVEYLVGTVADRVEAVEGEGRPGAGSDEPLEAFAVGGFDADAPIEAKPVAVLPAEHVLGVVGFQEAVPDHVAEDSLSDGVL